MHIPLNSEIRGFQDSSYRQPTGEGVIAFHVSAAKSIIEEFAECNNILRILSSREIKKMKINFLSISFDIMNQHFIFLLR